MLDISVATDIIKRNLPDGDIQSYVSYQDLFIFQVFSGDPEEREMDPFFSVNKNTGEFRDFSILTDGEPEKIVALFTDAQANR